MNLNDLTIIICSYNQPQILEYALKSLVYHHPDIRFKLLIVENSTDEIVENMLDSHKIPYWINDTGLTTHSPSMSIGLKMIKTKYALMMDSDVLIQKPITKLLNIFVENNLDLAGTMQGDRGGYTFKNPRIAPHFSLINIENMRKNNIDFHRQEIVNSTFSQGFFNVDPIQHKRDGLLVDVGTTFYDEFLAAGLRVADYGKMDDYIVHVESLSWAEKSSIPQYRALGETRRKAYMDKAIAYENVDIDGKFDRWE